MKFLQIAVSSLIVFVIGVLLYPIFVPANLHCGPRNACLSNVKQLALGQLMYSSDFDDHFPSAEHWVDQTNTYAKSIPTFHCSGLKGSSWGYAFNLAMSSARAPQKPEMIPLIYDSTNLSKNASDFVTSLPHPGRHKGFNNVGYADGHAKRVESKP